MLTLQNSFKQYLETLSPAEQAEAKSYLLNIFRSNPWLSRFYAGYLQLTNSNPRPINNLPTRSENFFNPDPKGRTPVSLNQKIRICTHIKVNGTPCGSPALRGEVFCYFHQRMIRGVRTPPKSRLHPIALIENEEAIQASLMEVINALVRNTIDLRRAQLILRALHIAARNASRVRFQMAESEMVREVPDYPAAPAGPQPPSPAIHQAGALARIPRPKPVPVAPSLPAAIVAAAAPDPPPPQTPPPGHAALPVRNPARRRSG
jgi:hypothetical protein